MKLTAKDLIAIAPKSKPQIHLEWINKTLEKYQINTPLRVAAFIAQCGHESFDYKTGETFGAFEEFASGAAYEGRKDLGNVQKGDGVKYKGRGAIMNTGRFNYAAYSKFTGVDFLKDPKKLKEPQWAWDVAGWFWANKGLNLLADKGNFLGITRIINGGVNGLEDREKRYLLALTYFRDNGMA